MSDLQKDTIGYARTHKIIIYFEGIFQDRLATDPDPSNEIRGLHGWTFAHSGEPDLDRIIRFNNPVAERSCVDPIRVVVTRINVDGSDVNDPLIGEMVNLGPQSFFDGSRGAGDGYEPIINFEFHIGNSTDYIRGKATEIPRGTGAVVMSKEMEQELGINDMEQWRSRRIECLNSSISNTPGSKEDIIRRERSDKILLTGFVRDIRAAVLRYIVRYPCIIDKDVYLEPQGSLIVGKMKQANINRLYFNADFYSYDGDGLLGHIKGTITGTFVD